MTARSISEVNRQQAESTYSIAITWLLVQCFSSPERKADTLWQSMRARDVGREGTLTVRVAGFHTPCHVCRVFSTHMPARRCLQPSRYPRVQHRKQLLQLPTAQQLSHPGAAAAALVVTTNQNHLDLSPRVLPRAGTHRCPRPRPPSYVPYLASASSSHVRRAYHQRWAFPDRSRALPHHSPTATARHTSTHTCHRLPLATFSALTQPHVFS